MKETRVFGIAPWNPSFFLRSVADNLTSKIGVKHLQQTYGVGMFKGRVRALLCVASYVFVVFSSGWTGSQSIIVANTDKPKNKPEWKAECYNYGAKQAIQHDHDVLFWQYQNYQIMPSKGFQPSQCKIWNVQNRQCRSKMVICGWYLWKMGVGANGNTIIQPDFSSPPHPTPTSQAIPLHSHDTQQYHNTTNHNWNMA